MPVLTVAAMKELAASGRLNGRFAAVGGYWMQYALPCAFQPHVALISGFCAGGLFADSRADVASYNGAAGPAPLVMPETANADELRTATGNDPAAAVLIVHAADSRYWQCAPSERADCTLNLVIDNVAWINGSDVQQAKPPANLVAAGEQLVVAYQTVATSMNDVDPRFTGEGSGQVWYGRTAYGSPDADGTTAGVSREVAITSSAVVDERTLAVSDKYEPGRVVLDGSTGSSAISASPQFTVLDGTTEVVSGALGMQTPPITLYAAPYSLVASLAGTKCTDQVTIDASSDVSFVATFRASSCNWAVADPGH
jgi:hypothetical protein